MEVCSRAFGKGFLALLRDRREAIITASEFTAWTYNSHPMIVTGYNLRTKLNRNDGRA